MTTPAHEPALTEILARVRSGEKVIVTEGSGDALVGEVCVAGELTTPDDVGFMAVHARGLVCLAVPVATLQRLEIPLITPDRSAGDGIAYGTSFEATEGVTTGISAADRARSIQVAVDQTSGPRDVVMPGHVPPIRVAAGGVLVHPGRFEAAFDLVRLCGLRPGATVCAILNGQGDIATGQEVLDFAAEHGLVTVSVESVVGHRLRTELLVERLDETELTSGYGGHFRAIAYRNRVDGTEHLALVRGRISGDEPVLVRVHSQCLTGDVLGSRRCDCGEQLEESVRRIDAEGRGVLVYLHQEGRGIGLGNKIMAYALQDQGRDTVEANLELGFTDDPRDYGISAQILRDLGIQQVRLLTNNERKISGLEGHGVEISERVSIEIEAHEHNIEYLRTKREKLGHLLTGLEE